MTSKGTSVAAGTVAAAPATPEEKVDYECSCKLGKSAALNPVSASGTPNKDKAEAALKKLKEDIQAAMDVKVGNNTAPTEPERAALKTAVDSIKVGNLDKLITDAGLDGTAVTAATIATLAEVNTAMTTAMSSIPIAIAPVFTKLESLKTTVNQIDLSGALKGGKRKHTRRKHCRHGKNIMHCPYCKHSTKGKHCNKSKKSNKRRRTRKLDRIARSLERSLERSLNESHNSKKSKRSRRKSK